MRLVYASGSGGEVLSHYLQWITATLCQLGIWPDAPSHVMRYCSLQLIQDTGLEPGFLRGNAVGSGKHRQPLLQHLPQGSLQAPPAPHSQGLWKRSPPPALSGCSTTSYNLTPEFVSFLLTCRLLFVRGGALLFSPWGLQVNVSL